MTESEQTEGTPTPPEQQNNPKVYEFGRKPATRLQRIGNAVKRIARIGATTAAFTTTGAVYGGGAIKAGEIIADTTKQTYTQAKNISYTGLDAITYPFTDHENMPNEPVVEIFDGELILTSSLTNPNTGEKVALNLRRKPEIITKFDTGQQSDEANKVDWDQIVDFRGKDIIGIKNPEIVHGVNADGTEGVGRWARFKVRVSDPLGRDDETFVYGFVGGQTAEVIKLQPNNPDKQYVPASEFSNPDHPVETNVFFTPELTSISK